MESLSPNIFEPTKQEVRNYFVRLALQVKGSLKMHKSAGLWDKERDYQGVLRRTEQGRLSDWANVSEHCLVEVARIAVLAEYLGLPDEIKGDLKTAAALHDFFKKEERRIARAGGGTSTSYEEASRQSSDMLAQAGFSEGVRDLADSVGSNSAVMQEVEQILGKSQLTDDEVAYLAMHYVDDYTVESNWVLPIEILPDGTLINDLDRRMNKNEARYPQLKAEGAYEEQRRLGYLVEDRLAQLISERQGVKIEPKKLPEIIDARIKQNIISSFS